MHFQNPIITCELFDRAIAGAPGRTSGIHGLEHWVRVERNGLFLSATSEANRSVVSLFALFHDVRRFNDGADPGHGSRGGRLAEEIFGEGLLPIHEAELEILVYACENHTDEIHSEDATIGTCWDSDRLDLPRIGVSPDPEFLNTKAAKRLAGSDALHELDGFRYSGSP